MVPSEAELRLADEALEEARILLERGRWRGAATRAYYAAYHAVRSLLLDRGIAPKTHEGTLRAFGVELIEKGVAQKDHGRMLASLYKLREVSDYVPAADVGKSEATGAVEKARVLVSLARGAKD